MDDDPLTTTVVSLLREAFYMRKAHDRLRMKDVAERMGCSVAYVSAVLGGKKTPTLRMVALFAHAMDYRPVLKLTPTPAAHHPPEL